MSKNNLLITIIAFQLLIVVGSNFNHKVNASSSLSETNSTTTYLLTSSALPNGPIIFPDDDDDDKCHPIPDPKLSHYIVAYGSLMSTLSKERTFKNTGANIPVQIHGYRREWNLKGDDLGPDTTYLGVVLDATSSFNGVIFQLPQSPSIVDSLKSYDGREKFYCRRSVDTKNILVLAQNQNFSSQPITTTTIIGSNGSRGGAAQFWIYVNKPEFTHVPCDGYPIVQSYVDVFMTGCLEMEEKFGLKDFSKMCVTSTTGWSGDYWINDRIFPRRPHVHQPLAGKIDAVLYDRIPKEFDKIKIEGFGGLKQVN